MAQPSAAPRRTAGGGRRMGPGARALAAVDVVLVLAFLVLLALHLANNAPGGADEGDDPTDQPVASQPVASPPVDEVAPEPETTPEASAPAEPAETEALAEFVLPSGNIWCSMTETSATCTIGSFSYAPPTPPEGCTGTVGSVFSVTAAEGATMPCVSAPLPRPDDATVLEYGQASTVGEVTCHSSRNGATCRHNPTGQGFSVARAGYTIL